ncbi:IS3 family transposase, partial [Staphylococcus gallinarum]|uniref:IS3 family transposase n=2 Tax=Staphylococcus gallinarum TaxID=1293 RepID=UPI000FEE88C9
LCEEKGIIRSMSRKGTPADNAPIESFHSSLKCETFYINNELNCSNQIVIDIVENYIKNYNNNRIQQKLGYLSPIKYRELAA